MKKYWPGICVESWFLVCKLQWYLTGFNSRSVTEPHTMTDTRVCTSIILRASITGMVACFWLGWFYFTRMTLLRQILVYKVVQNGENSRSPKSWSRNAMGDDPVKHQQSWYSTDCISGVVAIRDIHYLIDCWYIICFLPSFYLVTSRFIINMGGSETWHGEHILYTNLLIKHLKMLFVSASLQPMTVKGFNLRVVSCEQRLPPCIKKYLVATTTNVVHNP